MQKLEILMQEKHKEIQLDTYASKDPTLHHTKNLKLIIELDKIKHSIYETSGRKCGENLHNL